MNNKLIKGLIEETNYTLTENLALTHKSTLNYLLDFFSMGGALRTRGESEIISLFTKAFAQDKLLTLKCLFYFRDIRGGQGERRTFRIILHYLGDTYPDIVKLNLPCIASFGRWDDLYALVGTKSQGAMFEYLKMAFDSDCSEAGNTTSLLGKWLKSENTSSESSKFLGSLTRKAFGLSHKQYRKHLTRLRKQINIVEALMSAKKWSEINYEAVPSRAAMIYRNAFKRHDEARYNNYIESVKKGEAKIHAGTLYPYDIIRNISKNPTEKDTLDVLWNNLPDYTEGAEENSIVVCDTSGSMFGGGRQPEPIYVSVSLAIYFAERNKGIFKDHFITFSKSPEIQTIIGSNIYEKWNNLSRADWGMNTNLQAVFNLILQVAIKYKIPQDEMINKIYIISDMEFDEACTFKTNFEVIKEKYKQTGYIMPTLIFWNVDSRQDQAPITVNDKGVYLVSGCSPSIFETLMKSGTITAYDLMLDVLLKERYNIIKT